MTSDFDVSWLKVLRRLLAIVSAGQLASARAAADYVPAVLDELNVEAPAAAEFNPAALVGVASDGRPLDSLLYTSVIRAKRAVADGAQSPEALEAGRRWLDMAVHTQMADAQRVAVQTVIASRVRLGGYVRMLNPPSCSRCIILAGAFYRWNDGFQRHPRCDCMHIPAQEDAADELLTEPHAYFDSLSKAEQDRIFTAAGAEAIRLGADIRQVVNARRGMRSTRLHGREALVTTEGITRRGVFGSTQTDFEAVRVGRRGYIRNQVERRAKRARLMPETILANAEDREDAMRLLKLYGYLT